MEKSIQTFKASLVFVLKTKLSYGFIHPAQLTDFLLKSYKVNPATLSIPDGQRGQLTFSKSDTTKLRTETANPHKCQALQMLKYQHFPSGVEKRAPEVKRATGLLQQPVKHHLPVAGADGHPEFDVPTVIVVTRS